MTTPRLAVLAATLLVTTSWATARTGYDVTPLESLGAPGSWAWDVNNSGQIVGHAFGVAQAVPGTDLLVSSSRAVLWSSDATQQELGSAAAGSVSIAHGVNDAGDVVGRSRLGTSGLATAFKWSGGVMTPLTTPADHESEAFAANNADTEVGSILPQGGLVLRDARAVRWQDGVMTDLSMGDWQASAASAVNDAGDIAGWYTTAWPAPQRAVLWTADGQTLDLGTLDGAPYSVALALNDAGTVVGYSGHEWAMGNFVNRAFVYQDGLMSDLGTLGGNFSKAYDVSAEGHVVGQAETSTGADHAFLWAGAQMIDLNTRIPADSGWELLAATGINDAGVIVGYGSYAGEVMAFQMQASAPDPCPADVTGDGSVDVMDLVEVLTRWGNCPADATCTGDVNYDAAIGITDLLEVMMNWGACPNT